MRIYLDMCCLKRPFDDQSQPRLRLESEAVLGLLAVESDSVQIVRSQALFLENSRNPVKDRAARVNQWLLEAPMIEIEHSSFKARIEELMGMGFKGFDAIHIASAEQASADALGCCDDRFIATAARNRSKLRVRVVPIVELAKELIP